MQTARAIHRCDAVALRREARRWPALAKHILDDGETVRVRDAKAVHKLLREAFTTPDALLSHRKPGAESGSGARGNGQGQRMSKATAANILLRPAQRRWFGLWVPHMRRQWLGRVLPPREARGVDAENRVDAERGEEESESRRALCDHWGPIFAERHVDEELADSLIRRHVHPAEGHSIEPPTTTMIRATLRRLRDTAPGLDGLPYSSWRAGGREAAEALRRVISAAATSASFPQGFCDAVAVFLPKGSHASDDDATGRRDRVARDTRPLALLDTVTKTAMSVVNRPLAKLLVGWAPEQQQGFIAGRTTVRNILRLDTRCRILSLRATMSEWSAQGASEDGPAHDEPPELGCRSS